MIDITICTSNKCRKLCARHENNINPKDINPYQQSYADFYKSGEKCEYILRLIIKKDFLKLC